MKMNRKKMTELKTQIETINMTLSDLGVSEDVLEREVKSFGNGAHIVIPKQHVNKRVKIVIG